MPAVDKSLLEADTVCAEHLAYISFGLFLAIPYRFCSFLDINSVGDSTNLAVYVLFCLCLIMVYLGFPMHAYISLQFFCQVFLVSSMEA